MLTYLVGVYRVLPSLLGNEIRGGEEVSARGRKVEKGSKKEVYVEASERSLVYSRKIHRVTAFPINFKKVNFFIEVFIHRYH